MKPLFLYYPKCSTCIKAKKHLETLCNDFDERFIKEQNPTLEELKEWHEKSGLDIKKFFNTSGKLYKEMNLKEALPTMSLEEKYALLASDGMLVKRPILIVNDQVLVGFKAEEYNRLF